MARRLLPARRRVWGVAAVLAMAAITTTGCYGNNSGASGADLLALTNQARAANGLGPLTPCGKLDAAAYAHANDMWANNFNSHTGSDGSTVGPRASQQGYAWTAVAENLAWGYPTVSVAFDNWMSSPGHRANILNPGFVHHGWAHVGDRWVQVFGAGAC